VLFVGATGFLSQQQLMHVPLHDRYIPLSRTMGYRSRNQCVRVAFLLSKGATVEEVQHAMHVLGVPADVAALSISTAAASAAAAAAASATAPPSDSKTNGRSFWRRLLVVGAGLAGAWSGWNLYGHSVIKWGSGVMQWLEGGGEAVANGLDEQQEQPCSLHQLGTLPDFASSHTVLRGGNTAVADLTEPQQIPASPAHDASLPGLGMQAEALKVFMPQWRASTLRFSLLFVNHLSPSPSPKQLLNFGFL
jgi:hypothetical protein